MGIDAEEFRLGVNYWPAVQAMAWLADYEPEATRSDFRRVADAGMSTIRVFVRWEDAQPGADQIDAGVLGCLVDAADAASAADVELIVTLFTGHMSGVNWLPGWATQGGGVPGGSEERFRIVSGGRAGRRSAARNWYGDPDVWAAQERLAAATAGALCGHPAIWAWDLGNENSNCSVPPGRAAGSAWLERMTTAIRRADPGRLITLGLHMEDLEEDRMIGPAEAARWCDIISMHGYPSYAAWAAGPTDVHLVAFLASVTRWLAGGAPVLFEEFGLPTMPAPHAGGATGAALPGEGRSDAPSSPMAVGEKQAGEYTGAVLDNLWREGCVGALLWCFSDYCTPRFAEAPFDEAIHERSFGLWRADGTPKPAVAELSARAGRSVRAPTIDPSWLDISPEEFASDRKAQLARLYGHYRAAAYAQSTWHQCGQ